MGVLDIGWMPDSWVDVTGAKTVSTWTSGVVELGGYTYSAIALDGGATPDSTRFTFGAPRAAGTDFWVHFRYRSDAVVTSGNAGVILRGGAIDLFRIFVINTSHDWRVDYWNGSAWVQVGSNITAFPINISRQIDIRLNMHNTTGVFAVYCDETLVANLAGGDTIFTAENDIDDILMRATSSSASYDTYFSDFITADVDTRKWRLAERTTTAAGALQEMAGGSESDIDNIPQELTSADSTWVTATVANQKNTYTMQNINALLGSGHNVVTMWQSFRARRVGVNAPLNIRPIIRKGGINYAGATQTLVQVYATYRVEWPTDPSTASAWTNLAAINAAEIGIEAV